MNMRKNDLIYVALLLLSASCMRNSSQTWEDLKTAGRYMHRGVDAVFGKEYESRLLTSDEEFTGPYDEEFIPLQDSDLKNTQASLESAIPQPKGIPGQKGIPSLSEFYPPSGTLQAIFKPVHFHTDEYAIKEKRDLEVLSLIATYMKEHAKTLLTIEGHCDERASASYNLALGMRRANYVRSFLVKQGIDLNRIYTVSRGKEQPTSLGHSPEDWKTNRRSEFKIYEP